jgi:hypothetical protein
MGMNFLLNIRKPLASLLVLTFTGLTVAWVPAQAAMVGTTRVLKENHQDRDRERLRTLLDREEVCDQLEAWGVDSEIAKARIDSLTDEEVAEIVGRLDQLPAGGSTVGVLVGAAVIIFIILLITDILGLTDVFPFVKKHR